MGLLLLIPGLILALNGTNWFEGEDGVASVLIWVGAILLVLQVLITLGMFAWVGRQSRRSFDRW
jgi:hypothetical protein